MSEARRLTVAHQTPGECSWCDDRHNKIVKAIASGLAQGLMEYADSGPGDGMYRAGLRDAAELIEEATA